jgi:hypothetical protein
MPKALVSDRRNTFNSPAPLAANPDLLRRGFLLTLGGASAAVAAARALSAGAIQPVNATAAADRATKSKGYTASEHVRKYYRTTKI